MSQLEGSLALGRAPASHGSPGGARARSAAAGLLIVLCLAAIAALPQREARFESPGSEGTAPGPQALSNSLGPPPANLAADTSAIALPAETTQPALPAAAERRAADAYARLPLAFVPNAGQSDERVRYYAQGAGYGLYFTDHKAVLALEKGDRGHALELRFLGANPNAEPVARDRATGRVNYLTGSEHQTDLPTYGRVVYRDLWPGIDMTFLGEGGKLRYEFRLRPGAQASDIRLAYAGAEDVSLARGGALRINTPLGALRDAPPKSFQRINGRRVPVESRYALADDSYGFSVGRHDRGRPLVIDPSLAYSTYLGGSDADFGSGIAVDSAGAAYVSGSVRTTDFPTTVGAFDTSANGDDDAFVTKLNSNGSGLAYSTYLGGSFGDNGHEVAVDSAGAAYITGFTQSSDFPTTAGAFDTSANGDLDAFVTKLNPGGSGLDYSTFLGGSEFDDAREVAVDSAGAAYITGFTHSSDFPTTAGAFDTSYNGDEVSFQADAFVTKLNPAGSGLAYSTYLGGAATDGGEGVAVDRAGAAYVTGETFSTGFPTTAGAFDTSFNSESSGGPDAFVAKLNPGGSGLAYSTYLGGGDFEEGRGVAVDSAGAAYVTGWTFSTDFPTTAGAFDTGANGNYDVFVTRLNPTGSGLSYSTYLGGSFQDTGVGIAADSAGAAYVTGFTLSTDFPTTAGAFDTSANGNIDAFVTKLALGPGFSAAVDLDTRAACCPQVASDADGDAVAVWTHSDDSGSKVRVRSISAGGALGPVRRLSGTNPGPRRLPAPQIASDAGGDAIAVFSRRGPKFWRAKARMISAGGVLGTPITLSAKGGDAFNAQIASDAQGDAVAVWERFDGNDWRVQGRAISRGGALGPVLNLSAAGEDALRPQVASDADGDSVAVWERFDGANWQVEARAISSGGALGPVLNLSVPGKDRYDAQVAIDGQGDAVAVWASTLDRDDPRASGQTIQARTISRTGALGAIVRLPAAGREDLAEGPQIASDADGDAVAIWTVERLSTPDQDFAVQVRRIARSGALGPVTDLDTSVAESPLEQAQIASDRDGDAVAVWHQQYFGACEGGGDVLARPISGAGVLGPTTTLSEQPVSPGGEPLCGFHSDAPQIASDADGDVVVVWEFDDFEAVQMSQGP